jgi:hypothetical protein
MILRKLIKQLNILRGFYNNMTNYIGEMPEDFDPMDFYKVNNDNNRGDEFDFQKREISYEDNYVHNSRVTLNLRKRHPK